jgi:hypothetical protein
MGQQEGLVGQRAYQQQYFDVVCNIQLPYRLFTDDPKSAKKVVSTVLQSALTDVLDRVVDTVQALG